ncbi:hypothetical protein CLV59_104208 [Chitinophaga dinghuensis]|uniref:Uncharacterized protein n=1 Tax=Chitinophaga dinghuensis TaxID=1539050 RepID=A0A327W028_9BACT|nr:hypothetical protein [Chitinophaga dinghuensis]RAJ81983.1 hypothetical protein CLV59_104208 [Chitinophaga dinghuensis]
MKKAKILLLALGFISIIGGAIASKAKGVSLFYRPLIHGGSCTISTLLFLTTTVFELGQPYEIARSVTTDSCVEYCTGYN